MNNKIEKNNETLNVSDCINFKNDKTVTQPSISTLTSTEVKVDLPEILPMKIDTPTIHSFKRNSDGLIENLEYKYQEDGRIDWRAMIKPEHLVVFKEKRKEVEEKYGKKIEELDLTTIDDKYLLLLLIGIKHVAALRGFLSVRPHVDEANSQRCVVTTIIKWMPNFETGGLAVEYGDVGSASLENTYSFGQRYLEAVAANRAFVRAVRNFLGINIVAYDEVGPNKDSGGGEENSSSRSHSISSGYKPHNMLEQKVESKGLNFSKFKEGIAIKYKNSVKGDPEKWFTYEDIPPSDIYILLGILEKK